MIKLTLFYIFADLLNIWLNLKQLDFCFCILSIAVSCHVILEKFHGIHMRNLE